MPKTFSCRQSDSSTKLFGKKYQQVNTKKSDEFRHRKRMQISQHNADVTFTKEDALAAKTQLSHNRSYPKQILP